MSTSSIRFKGCNTVIVLSNPSHMRNVQNASRHYKVYIKITLRNNLFYVESRKDFLNHLGLIKK